MDENKKFWFYIFLFVVLLFNSHSFVLTLAVYSLISIGYSIIHELFHVIGALMGGYYGIFIIEIGSGQVLYVSRYLRINMVFIDGSITHVKGLNRFQRVMFFLIPIFFDIFSLCFFQCFNLKFLDGYKYILKILIVWNLCFSNNSDVEFLSNEINIQSKFMRIFIGTIIGILICMKNYYIF